LDEDYATIKYNPLGPLIYTVAGGGVSDPGNGGPATSAVLIYPDGIAVDATGNLFISEELSTHRVRRVDALTGIISAFAGTGTKTGSIDGEGGNPADDLGDGGPAVNATLNDASGLGTDAQGNVYIADSGNNRVRRVDAATGIITTVAGNGSLSFNGDGIPATSATLRPSDVAVDSAGNLYIADIWHERIRKVDAVTGLISTVAGNGTQGFSGDGGPAVNASMSGPMGIAVYGFGNIYFSDWSNQRVRKVDAVTGIINTVAGTGSTGYNGDGIPATSANLTMPHGICVDYEGNIFIAEYNGPGLNCRIRKVYAATGVIMTVAGTGNYSHALPEGIPAVSAEVNHATGVVVDSKGNIWMAYYYQPRVRKVKVLND
jgi:sugar lactone lactonase YvrE